MVAAATRIRMQPRDRYSGFEPRVRRIMLGAGAMADSCDECCGKAEGSELGRYFLSSPLKVLHRKNAVAIQFSIVEALCAGLGRLESGK
jgi:hypothetical protein